jgi:DNA gyrase/topoisomerase IV subunit A
LGLGLRRLRLILTRFPAEGVSSIKGQFPEFESGRFAEVMVISHYGKIIRMDSKTIRESGRNAQGVGLLQMEP